MYIGTRSPKLPLAILSATFLFAIYGCDRKSDQQPTPASPKIPAPTSEKPKEPLIKKAEIVDWCPEHGVPESICTRCNKDLIESFKKKGDWCAKHDLPESQCLVCHPELKSKFDSMKPKNG